jgi:hypothetical protein
MSVIDGIALLCWAQRPGSARSGRKLLKPDLGKQMNKHNDTSGVQISLTADEALVLFEFLSRFEKSNELSIVDQAEERALSNQLEEAINYCKAQHITPPKCPIGFEADYHQKIRDRVAETISNPKWWEPRI